MTWDWTTLPRQTTLGELIQWLNRRLRALQQSLNVPGGTKGATVTVTVAYTALTTDDLILCNATSGAFSVTLPPVAGALGVILDIKKIDSSANAVTVDGASSETIDDATTAVITVQYEDVTVHCDGTEWWIK